MPTTEPFFPRDRELTGESSAPETVRLYPERELPQVGSRGRPRESARMSHTAESIGSALGSAVERAKRFPDELPKRLQGIKKRFTLIAGRARDRAHSAVEDAQETATEGVHRARNRAERMAEEQPLHVIAGAAVFGLVLGIALQIWRNGRE